MPSLSFKAIPQIREDSGVFVRHVEDKIEAGCGAEVRKRSRNFNSFGARSFVHAD
jgi:hypothetical protein